MSPSASSRPLPLSPHPPRPVFRRTFPVNRHSVPDRASRYYPNETSLRFRYLNRPGAILDRPSVLPALFPFWHPHRPRRPAYEYLHHPSTYLGTYLPTTRTNAAFRPTTSWLSFTPYPYGYRAFHLVTSCRASSCRNGSSMSNR
ncbi:hypothetical protein LX36DRAFT_388161 [Colletotrichum falcatum]|nr:hypothetical protein LX36DRAFT_388161 [Colletotrichum falcatum]